jgi:hypothetical protein
MNLNTFFRLINPDPVGIDKLLQEMSYKIPAMQNPLNSPMAGEIFRIATELGKYVEDFRCSDGRIYNVYEYTRHETPTLYFLHNHQWVVASIELNMTANAAKIEQAYGIGGVFKGIVSRIYVEYLLSKTKSVISDSAQTAEGFNIYRYILREHEKFGVNVYVWNTKTDEKFLVNEVEELEKYFGDTNSFGFYRFIITKK